MTEEEQGNPYAKRLTKKERQILDNLPEGSYIQALQRDAQGIPIFTPEQETAHQMGFKIVASENYLQ
ncbi:hypothetical protein A3C59_01100 [Candidatus Daviesbacteria bacterium RIFCSPHIGHO2_02_FULL_36_13]|uniref:Uncharacterized protein n=1 Tax=Candidatus Daviesbacteria bacterium RIFCSPHIGHO2_02_FULL_36_13 TaxID=1797768 RepID=A0A1F5JWK2_9BACT|nr:MAG: hypothetical protein A3C59_01100 [Candidatus Daviesbacteria bacterium RIFCSPHIGHO2_02_FULL_36_13]